MSDCMYFPDTVEEFMEQYKMTDAKQVYSNGTEYVPIFRMKQWFEHEKVAPSHEGTTSDTISRQQAIDALDKQIKQCCKALGSLSLSDVDKHAVEVEMASLSAYREILENLPTVQPEPQEGEWELKDHQWECNKCGCRINVKNPLCDNNWNYYFCPHCGTKMIIAVQRFLKENGQ